MRKIVNLTQHSAVADQLAAGVVDLDEGLKAQTGRLLDFKTIPSTAEMVKRADAVAELAAGTGCSCAMIGGAPFFMSHLEAALLRHNLEPVYAFSLRQSVDEPQPDGTVIKRQVFKHSGFVRPFVRSCALTK